jgi:hypothetical protein
MFIPLNSIKNKERSLIVDKVFERINRISGNLSFENLTWAIKMETAYEKYGNLTDKQLFTLVELLAKYEDEE